jgi:predicted component of type VI protein secretion system
MSARLVPLNAGVAPTIPLQRPVLLIGRHPECDVRIDLGKISRRHCCVALAYDRVMIRDLGSRNGLRVNGVTVEEAQLHPGDEVAIGPIIYRMEAEAPAPPPPIPAPRPAASAKPPSLPDPHDPEGDLIPIDL